MANRKQRAKIASETLALLERESYTLGEQVVSLSASLTTLRAGTLLYTPSQLDSLVATLDPPQPRDTQIRVRNQTTFAAARELATSSASEPLCLNFASAKNPGGGFLSGSQAQEECLARASGLHASLTLQMPYYEANRSHRSSLYTNHIIYSPSVPVFRDDEDRLLSQPYTVSFITSPAVNAGAVRKNEPSNVAKIQPTMRTRIRSVLAVARHHGHDRLVLGAWGCGVFRNDPNDIAQGFANALNEPRFKGAFASIVFAVLDVAEETPTCRAFERVFST